MSLTNKTTQFPVFINMKDRQALVFGGGKIAKRRICVLLDFGTKVRVISPKFDEQLYDIANTSRNLELIEGTFEEWRDMGGFENELPFFVLACTDNHQLNKMIADYARENNVMVNVCDDASNCDFYFPAIVRKDEMVIGITGNGASHGKVSELAKRLRDFFGQNIK